MTGVMEITMTEDLAALRPIADGERLDDVTVRALDLVIDANGDLDVWFAIGTGALEGRLSSVQRFARRSGGQVVPTDVAAGGLVAVPPEEAVQLCSAFCRREPLTVVNHLVAEELRIERGESAPGGDRVARRARALVRSWIAGR